MIYVDEPVNYGSIRNTRWKHSSHLLADSEEELLKFAKKIGLPLGWFQKHKIKYLCHFDLSNKWRKIAIENGAVEMKVRDVVKKLMNAHKTKTGK